MTKETIISRLNSHVEELSNQNVAQRDFSQMKYLLEQLVPEMRFNPEKKQLSISRL